MPTPEKSPQSPSGPAQVLSLGDATAIIVGLIIGAGIFGTPSIVAGAVENPGLLVAVWVAGGAFSVIGALCYAELATAFPSAGGEYHFIGRAYGRSLAFLYGWARMTVVVAGSIAVSDSLSVGVRNDGTLWVWGASGQESVYPTPVSAVKRPPL